MRPAQTIERTNGLGEISTCCKDINICMLGPRRQEITVFIHRAGVVHKRDYSPAIDHPSVEFAPAIDSVKSAAGPSQVSTLKPRKFLVCPPSPRSTPAVFFAYLCPEPIGTWSFTVVVKVHMCSFNSDRARGVTVDTQFLRRNALSLSHHLSWPINKVSSRIPLKPNHRVREDLNSPACPAYHLLRRWCNYSGR